MESIFLYILISLLYVPVLPQSVFSCVSCKPGTFSDASKDECNITLCGGAGMCKFANYCTDCLPGQYQDEFNSTSCDLCPPGHFSSKNKSEQCDPCPGGQYTPNNGSKECLPCGPGNGTKGNEATECIICGAGTYSPGNSLCIQCSPGTYNSLRGQKDCIDCGKGFFQRDRGATQQSQCQMCQPGFFCPASDNGYPSRCKANYYCPTAGLTNPYVCPALQVSDQGSQSCFMGPIFYVLLVGSIFLVLFVAWVIYHWRSSRKHEELIYFEERPIVSRTVSENEPLVSETPTNVIYSGL